MKSIIFVITLLFISHNSLADTYGFIKNSAIKGHNTMTLKGSITKCQETCDKFDWCKSFDFYKKIEKCDLSDKSHYQVLLKTDYAGNPFDHYFRKNSSVNPVMEKYEFVQNAAIKGHNYLRLSSRTVESCIIECNARKECKSFDYHKKSSKCDLSKKSKKDTDLKKNYPGDPYDHYYKK